MPLPVDARISAAQSFVSNVRAAADFLHEQDPHAAPARHAALLEQLRQAREHLRWNPEAGRPARFLLLRSAQGRAQSARASALAAAHGVPQLRELVLKPYILLYAHGADRVVLLALKHERELIFRLG
jgi:plasmid stabilization system protein ParE